MNFAIFHAISFKFSLYMFNMVLTAKKPSKIAKTGFYAQSGAQTALNWA